MDLWGNQGVMNMPELGSYRHPTGIAVGIRTRWLSDILQTLLLAHGFLAANHYGVGVVDDAVEDGIRQKQIGQLLQSFRNVKLETKDHGVSLVPGLHDFQ